MHFNSSEVKQHSKHKQRFHFNNCDEVKHCSERNQQFHFNISERKQHSECSQRFHFNISDEVKASGEPSSSFHFNSFLTEI